MHGIQAAQGGPLTAANVRRVKSTSAISKDHAEDHASRVQRIWVDSGKIGHTQGLPWVWRSCPYSDDEFTVPSGHGLPSVELLLE